MNKYVIRDKEYKMQILDLILKDKITVKVVAEKFSISEPTIYTWLSRYEKYGEEGFVGSGHQRKADGELRKLKKENERLKMQVEILKKVAAYQAKLEAEKKRTMQG